MNSLPVLRGRAAFIFQQSNFDIDRIIGFEAMRSHDVELMTSEAMREFDPEFQKNVRGGDFSAFLQDRNGRALGAVLR